MARTSSAPNVRQAPSKALARRDAERDSRAMTTTEAADQVIRKVAAMVSDKREQLTMLLAGQVDPERFITVALQAVQTQPGLLQCTPLSIFGAIREAAIYGLEPVGILGDAALVPYDGVAQLQLQYRGLRKLAMRDGTVKVVNADIVYAHDHFKLVSGDQPSIEHEPTLDDDRGALRGAYAYARFKNGELVHVWMTENDLVKRRNVSKQFRRAESKGTNDSIWHKWPEEQRLKTVVKRLASSKLPLTPMARQAIAADTEADLEDKRAARAKVVSSEGGDARGRLFARMGIGDATRDEGDRPQEGDGPGGPKPAAEAAADQAPSADQDVAAAGDAPAGDEAAGDGPTGEAAGGGPPSPTGASEPQAGTVTRICGADPKEDAQATALGLTEPCQMTPGHTGPVHRNSAGTWPVAQPKEA